LARGLAARFGAAGGGIERIEEGRMEDREVRFMGFAPRERH
jgi:hypothetical protein